MIKNSLSMLLYFFLASIAGTLIAGIVYMLAADLTLLVAGESFNFFCGEFFLKGLLASFPLMCSISLGLLILYGLRHKEFPVARKITLAVCGALCWLLLIPCCLSLTNRFEKALNTEHEVSLLSPGYFRKDSGGVFYFSRVRDNGNLDGLFIDIAGITGTQGTVIRFEDSKLDKDFSGDFADILIRDEFKLPFVVIAPIEIYSLLLEKANEAWRSGYLSWLCFALMACSLLASVVLEKVSAWRLNNALVISIISGAVILLNYFCYKGIIFVEAGEKISLFFADKAPWIYNPFVCLLNIVVFILLMITGIVLYAVSKESVSDGE